MPTRTVGAARATAAAILDDGDDPVGYDLGDADHRLRLVLVAAGSWRQSLSNEIKNRFRDAAELTNWPRGPSSWEELDEVFGAVGATVRTLPAVVERTTGTLEEDIKALEDGVYSVAWDVDDVTRKQAADAVRGWAEASFGSLTEVRVFDHTHEWRVYDLGS